MCVSLHLGLCELWASKLRFSHFPGKCFYSLSLLLSHAHFEVLHQNFGVCLLANHSCSKPSVSYSYIITSNKIQRCKPFIAFIWDSNSAEFSYTFTVLGLCSRPGTLAGMDVFYVPHICFARPSLGIWFSWWWQVHDRQHLTSLCLKETCVQHPVSKLNSLKYLPSGEWFFLFKKASRQFSKKKKISLAVLPVVSGSPVNL